MEMTCNQSIAPQIYCLRCLSKITKTNVFVRQESCKHRYCLQCAEKEYQPKPLCLVCQVVVNGRSLDYTINNITSQAVDFERLRTEMEHNSQFKHTSEPTWSTLYDQSYVDLSNSFNIDPLQDETTDVRLPFQHLTLQLLTGAFMNVKPFPEAVYLCAVCTENLLDPTKEIETVTMNRCSHTFCLKCIKEIISHLPPPNNTVIECPLCRTWNDIIQLEEHPLFFSHPCLKQHHEVQKNYHQLQIQSLQQYDRFDEETFSLMECDVHPNKLCSYIHQETHQRLCQTCFDHDKEEEKERNILFVPVWKVAHQINQFCETLEKDMDFLRKLIIKQIHQYHEHLSWIHRMFRFPLEFIQKITLTLNADLSQYSLPQNRRMSEAFMNIKQALRYAQAPQLEAFLLLINLRKEIREYIQELTSSVNGNNLSKYQGLQLICSEKYHEDFMRLVYESEQRKQLFLQKLPGVNQRTGLLKRSQLILSELQFMRYLKDSFMSPIQEMNEEHPLCPQIPNLQLNNQRMDVTYLRTVVNCFRDSCMDVVNKTVDPIKYLASIQEPIWICRGKNNERNPLTHDTRGKDRKESPSFDFAEVSRYVCVYRKHFPKDSLIVTLQRGVEHLPPCYLCLRDTPKPIIVNLQCQAVSQTQIPVNFDPQSIFNFGSALLNTKMLTLQVNSDTPSIILDTFLTSIYHLIGKLDHFKLIIKGDYAKNLYLESFLALLLPSLPRLTLLIDKPKGPILELKCLPLIKRIFEFETHKLTRLSIKLIEPNFTIDPKLLLITTNPEVPLTLNLLSPHQILYEPPTQSLNIKVESTNIRDAELLYFTRFFTGAIRNLPNEGINIFQVKHSQKTHLNQVRDEILLNNRYMSSLHCQNMFGEMKIEDDQHQQIPPVPNFLDLKENLPPNSSQKPTEIFEMIQKYRILERGENPKILKFSSNK